MINLSFRAKPLDVLLVVIISILFLISFIIHMPVESQQLLFGEVVVGEPVYNDFIANYRSIFMNNDVCRDVMAGKTVSTMWFDNNVLKMYCQGELFYPAPYIHYYIDLPPITGFAWFISTYVSYIVNIHTNRNPLATVEGLTATYITYSIIMYASLIVFLYFYKKILYKLGKTKLRNYLLIITSSLIIYSIYGWELFALVFLMVFIYEIIVSKESIIPYIFLGLFSSSYYLGLILVVYHVYRVFLNKENINSKSLLGLSIGLSPYLILFLLSPQSLTIWYNNILNHLGCNNCIYVIIGNGLSNQYFRAVALIVVAVLFIIYSALLSLGEDAVIETTIVLLFSAVFNIVFLPQTLLLLQPLLTLCIIRSKEVLAYYIADISNSGIIILWFKDYELRKQLEFLGIPVKYSPTTIDSPIQWIAQTRNILLILIMLSITMSYINKHREQLRKYIGERAGVA